MKFTVERAALSKMIRLVSLKAPGAKLRDKWLRLTVCQARVFVESNQTVAGVEALVFEDGNCTLPRESFLGVVRSYKAKNLNFEMTADGLRVENLTMPVGSYSPEAVAPANFKVFPVTDGWIAGTPGENANEARGTPRRGGAETL